MRSGKGGKRRRAREVAAEVVEERELQNHPLVDLIPPMSAEEYEGFKADIDEHGLREPIGTYQGKIIDGRHRYRACRELGIEPQFREWTGGGEENLIGFIFSQNFYRRHLDESQRAMVRLLVPDRDRLRFMPARSFLGQTYTSLCSESEPVVPRSASAAPIGADRQPKLAGSGRFRPNERDRRFESISLRRSGLSLRVIR